MGDRGHQAPHDQREQERDDDDRDRDDTQQVVIGDPADVVGGGCLAAVTDLLAAVPRFHAPVPPAATMVSNHSAGFRGPGIPATHRQ